MAQIKELLASHPEEWLAIEVTQEANGEPVKGNLVYHSRDRWEVWERTKAWQRLYITFAGPALQEGYAAAF